MQGGKIIVHRVLALCDENLLGKVFEDGDLCLDLKKSKSFYEGKRVSQAQALELLKNAENINVVGKKSVAAVKLAFGKTGKALEIAGVPHLQVYRV